MATHLGILPLYGLKDISESNNSSLKTAALMESTHVKNIPGRNFSTEMEDTAECDLSMNSTEIDKSTDTDIKPDIKDLSDIISNCDTVNSNISPFIKCNVCNENMSVYMNQDKIKQESTSHSTSVWRVKEEIMYCQSCSYSDMDIVRMKFHIFREHPIGAAVVANSFDKANCYFYDIILFCVKETCSFFTVQCDVYEEHLMSCCLISEILSEDENERLKSTVKFILDFKNKHNLNTVPGFLDYFSTFNTLFTCKDDKVQLNKDLENNSSSMLSGCVSDFDLSVSCANSGIKFENSVSLFPTPGLLLTTKNTDFNRTVCKTENTALSEGEQDRKPEQLSKPDPCNVTFASSSKGGTALIQSGDDRDVSDNIVLEMDVAGSHIDINSFKEETDVNKIREVKMYYADGYTNDLQVSSQQSGCVTKLTTETQPVDYTSNLYNEGIKMNSDHFNSDMITDSSNLTCDLKEEFGIQSFNKISDNVERYDYSMDLIQNKKNYTREKLFTCNIPLSRFAHSSVSIKLRKSHTEEKSFICTECGKTFNNNSNLKVHMKTHTGEKPYKCNKCGKTFSRNSHLIGHTRTHTGEKPFKCNECGKTFRRRDQLVVHMRKHTGEKPFRCNECGKTFRRRDQLVVHMRTHTGEKPFECNECGKTCCQNSDLIKHMRTHTGEKPVSCSECEKTFSRTGSLIVHMRTHTGEKPFKCNECGKTFGHNSNLIKHMTLHTGDKPFKCNECGKTFGYNNDLIKHRRMHTGEKPFKCNECGKTFGHNSTLVKHRRTHTGEKPFKCKECGKTCSQNSDLIKHTRTHTGEKPFQCSECGKNFSQTVSLTVHMRTHTGEKPFKCNECGKTFGHNSNLIKHRRTHTGKKPFKCNECGKTLDHNSNLIKHMKTHTEEKPFTCSICI